MKTETLTADEARELLEYIPVTGDFFWRVTRGGIAAGSRAGHVDEDGYRHIRIKDQLFLAHRIAWLIVNGAWPEKGIDHKNGVPGDDRIDNLREANQSQNMQNAGIRSDNKSGFKGVSWDAVNGKWVVRIRQAGGRYRNLGRFANAEDGHRAYVAAAQEMFGEFARAA